MFHRLSSYYQIQWLLQSTVHNIWKNVCVQRTRLKTNIGRTFKNCRGNHCVDSSTLPEIIVREHASPWRLPMQFKVLSCKEVMCEHDPEALLSSLGQNSFKID